MRLTPYRERLEKIRLAFPQPTSDRVHDSYLVHSVMRAMDVVDALKSESPILGHRDPLDFSAARQASLAEGGQTVESVTGELVKYCSGLTIAGHPQTQQNVIPPPTISSLIGVLLASLYNPNLVWDETSHAVAFGEVQIVAMISRLVGYDPEESAGVFTFGGTGTSLYGVKVGLEKALPGTMETGIRDDAVILASDASHYCRFNIAGWLGLGSNNLITIPTDTRNAINLTILREQSVLALKNGRKIAAFMVTLGTTDAFGLDDLQAIATLRDELVKEFGLSYVPHIHADAVIGWAWAVFNDYNFELNPLGFRPRTIRALAGAVKRIQHLPLADSIGIDFHKSGFAPYISSMVLFRSEQDLMLLRRPQEQMPYLYQFGEHRPGMYTVETSRSGAGILSAMANLKLFGKEGLQVIIGHIVEMTQVLREHLEGHSCITVLNRENFGPVTLFRAYPDGIDTFHIKEREWHDSSFHDTLLAHNEYNRRIYHRVREEALSGRGTVWSLTDCYRKTDYHDPIVALKSFILSPFVDEDHIEMAVQKFLEARESIPI